jgi:AraC family transcriptional regulator of adaptative response/methylated-DNA-[protein]-cysteine methyltransferase
MSSLRRAPNSFAPSREAAPTAIPADAWDLVAARAGDADGRFFFAVRTTGIFCRPSCPARRPKRENVEFFVDAEAARRSGYRACRRCRPDQARPRTDPIELARRLVEDRAEERITLEELARRVGLSPFHLQRRFKERYGLTPRELAVAARTARLKSSLREGGTVSRASYDAGYGSGSRVYEAAQAQLGMTPARYARGGRGLTIRYTVVGSPFGRLLVGVTDRGVAAVTLGQSDPALERGLEAEFPEAVRTRIDDGADSWLADLVERVARTLTDGEGDKRPPAIPLDLLGTTFQYRVWRALIEIPPGSTRSYREVARAIGRPRAARAVARAVASNRIAVLIPCHRVIRQDGSLGGYRWGVPTKRALLERETASRRSG